MSLLVTKDNPVQDELAKFCNDNGFSGILDGLHECNIDSLAELKNAVETDWNHLMETLKLNENEQNMLKKCVNNAFKKKEMSKPNDESTEEKYEWKEIDLLIVHQASNKKLLDLSGCRIKHHPLPSKEEHLQDYVGKKLWGVQYDVIILYNLSMKKELSTLVPLLDNLHSSNKKNPRFVIVYNKEANDSAPFREKCFKLGCNMATYDLNSIKKVLQLINQSKQKPKNPNERLYSCPFTNCGFKNLTETNLWHHCPLYHIAAANHTQKALKCPICNTTSQQPLQVHIRNEHGLCKTSKVEPEDHSGIPLYGFSLVVCQRPSDKKFLVVQEFASVGFWLPGGRVDPGELFSEAAVRETLEEAGVEVELKGILKIEHTAIKYTDFNQNHLPKHDYNRMRVIYYAVPKDKNALAKSVPDYESMGACWVSIKELKEIHLRGSEPDMWFTYVANKKQIYPLDIFKERLASKTYM